MPRASDPRKLAAWRERLQRFSKSRQSVARFCGQERVSAASFYHWRKQLRQQARRQRGTTPPGRFRPIAVVPAAPGLSIQLACGARIEVRAEDLEAIRTIVAELARAQRDRQSDGASC